MRILLIEDDKPLAEGLQHGLCRAGHSVDVVHDGEAGLNAVKDEIWDVVVLDLGLPIKDGWQVLRELRGCSVTLPVIILTARDAVSDRIRGLDIGADDYLQKPFDLNELLARIRAVTRRSGKLQHGQTMLGALKLDEDTRRFSLGAEPLELSPREFGLLELLLRCRGRVLSKSQIQEQLCDWSEALSDTAIEVCIHRLRKRLEGSGLQLRTVRGFGYLLSAHV